MEDHDQHSHEHRPRRGRLLAAGLAAAVLAIPGGALVSNAFAGEIGSSSTGSQTEQVQDPAPERDRERDRDCPKEDGGSGSGSESSGTGSDSPAPAV